MKRAVLLTLEDLTKCRIIERLNRFVVSVDIDGLRYRAHVNNTGRLEGFLEPGLVGYCLRREGGGRTTHRLLAIADGGSAALIDTALQMRAFEGAVRRNLIPWLDGAVVIRRNARLGASLLDYLLARDGRDVYLEVKSAVLRNGDYAMYPDCPTARGLRHIKELAWHVRAGGEAILLFVAALPRVKAFRPNIAADVALYRELIKAQEWGVELRAVRMALDAAANGIIIDEFDLPVIVP